MEQIDQGEPFESATDIREYFYLFKSWAWLIVLAGLLAGAGAYLVSSRTTRVYEASTRLLVSPSAPIRGVDPSALFTAETITGTYAEMLLDRQVLEGVIDQLKLQITPDELKETITVQVLLNTQLLVVTVEDTDPVLAADIANGIAAVFTDRIRQLQSQRFAASREGLAKQVSDMEGRIATISGQIAAIEPQIAAVATQTAAAAQTATVATQTAAATQTSPSLTQTVEAGGQIAPSLTQTVETAVQSVAPALPEDITTDPAVLVQLQARLNQYLTIYSSLVTSYEQVRLAEAQTSTNVVISESASIPSAPVRPNTILNILLSVVSAMALAAGVVLVSNILDDTIKNPDEFRKKFSLQILGVIDSHAAPKQGPITLAEPGSPSAEAFRALRTNIIFTSVDTPLRRILVTSPMPQDGKTTIASNLAVVLAQSEKKTLLMDADLRHPFIHLQFGLPNLVGLTDLFVRPLEDFSSVIQNVDELVVITSGCLPHNPSELMTSKTMGRVLKRLNQSFDLIVIDAPPVLTVTDAAALAPSMDGVLLVVKPGTTKLSALKMALERLNAVGARVLGVVLNEVDPANWKYGYFYSRYASEHSHYYKRENTEQKRTNGKVTHPLQRAKTIVFTCPKCGSQNIVRNGRNAYGNQQFWCKDCGKRGVIEPKPSDSTEQNEQILSDYSERSSMRGTQRTSGVSRNTLTSWLKKRPAKPKH